MLRTGWVVVRRTTRVSPSSSSMARVVSATWMVTVWPVSPAEGDLLTGDHDHAGVGRAALDGDRLGRGPRWWPAGRTPRRRLPRRARAGWVGSAAARGCRGRRTAAGRRPRCGSRPGGRRGSPRPGRTVAAQATRCRPGRRPVRPRRRRPARLPGRRVRQRRRSGREGALGGQAGQVVDAEVRADRLDPLPADGQVHQVAVDPEPHQLTGPGRARARTAARTSDMFPDAGTDLVELDRAPTRLPAPSRRSATGSAPSAGRRRAPAPAAATARPGPLGSRGRLEPVRRGHRHAARPGPGAAGRCCSARPTRRPPPAPPRRCRTARLGGSRGGRCRGTAPPCRSGSVRPARSAGA